ncbi:glutamate receptor 1-like, partial [Anneissia japonica]|uniref:glutamate receptor 1-like n=1 Tax=Anneissia japonica TaxID=1529436 RepID=UPI00142584FD
MYRDNADRYRGNARFRGYIMDLLEEIARVVKGINFEYEVELVADGKYGRRDEYSNEWDGMIGELVRRKADIAAGPVSITTERNQAVDFSYPFMHSGLQILIKHPNHVLDDPFAFMYPFGIEVWFLNAICFLMVSAVLWAINSFNPYEWKAAVERHETFGENVDNFNFKNSLWFSASTLVFQSYDASPRSTAGRVIAGFWWVFVVIMVFLYLTNLTFWLTASKRLATIRSAEDLLEQYEIKYGVVDEGSVYYFLKNSSNPDFQQMYSTVENTIPKPTVANVSEGIKRVRESNGDYAFIDETGILRYQADQAEPCNLYVTGGFISRNSYGLAVQKDSPLRDQLSYAIETLRDTRSLEHLERQWWQWDSKCGNLTTWEKQGIYSLTSVDLLGVYL